MKDVIPFEEDVYEDNELDFEDDEPEDYPIDTFDWNDFVCLV